MCNLCRRDTFDGITENPVVTVHTDVAHNLAVGSSVFLNGVEINHWKPDAQGNFVAKFRSDEINTLEGLITDDYNTLVMTGYTTDGEGFTGTQDIKVVDITPQGKN